MLRTRIILKYLLIIMIFYSLFNVFLFSLRYFLGSEAPLAVVEGYSMEPTLYDGDLLLVKGVENISNIKPFADIIVFYEPGSKDKLIVHRVIELIVSNNQITIVTKGDNNRYPDPYRVRETNVIGVVVARMPTVGSAIMAIQSPVGKTVTVTLLIITFVVNMLHDGGEEKDSPRKAHL